MTPPLGPRPSVAADPELVAQLRGFLTGEGRNFPCRPYELWTDVDDESLLSAVCALAAKLDAEYEARIGLEPQGPARETLVLFKNLQDFQTWERSQPGQRNGYAGHAAASKGIAILHADRPDDEVAATTLHELTHLVNRRALGSPLPRWLSEGLADALGDSAAVTGFLPLQGARGAEGELRRLRSGLEAGPSFLKVTTLVRKDPGSFDRAESGGPTYDYELSAFFVRFLLTQDDLAPRFRAFLAKLAQGARWHPDALWTELNQQPATVDQRFKTWLQAL